MMGPKERRGEVQVEFDFEEEVGGIASPMRDADEPLLRELEDNYHRPDSDE